MSKNQLQDEMQFSFEPIDDEEAETSDLWENYQKLCRSQNPPVTVISALKPVFLGNKYSAHLAHYKLGKELNLILKVLTQQRNISSLDLSDNSLDENCIPELINFMTETDMISILNLSDNPKIRTKGITTLLDGINDNRSLEVLNISNTGCANIGQSLAKFIATSQLLFRIDAVGCNMKQSSVDFANAIGSAEKLKRLNISRNMLHIGGKKFASLLGASCAKCTTLKKLYLSENAIDDDMCIALMKGLSDSNITVLDLSKNMIGENSGKAIAGFIAKSSTIKYLDISQNPVLNVTLNKRKGQQSLEEGGEKDQNKKDKKDKTYVPGLFSIFNNIPKNQSMMIFKILGVVCKEEELEEKLANIRSTNSSLIVLYKSQTSHYTESKEPIQLPKFDSSDDELNWDED